MYVISISCQKLNFLIDVLFVPDQDPDWDFYYAISLKQQSTGRRVAPLGHIIPVPSQPVFTLTP
jgi:hypothetical protein